MKKLLAPLFLVLASAAVHAQDAPKIPKQLTCEELAPRLTGRTYDPFLMYEVTRNRLQIRVTLFDGQASPVSQEFRLIESTSKFKAAKSHVHFAGDKYVNLLYTVSN